MLGDSCGVGLERGAVRDVQVRGVHIGTEPPGPVGSLAETRVVDVGQRQPSAATGELDGERPADAGPRSSDGGDPAENAGPGALLSCGVGDVDAGTTG